MWHRDSLTLEQMIAWAEALGRVAPAGTVLALHGELGAGKTTFAQGVARGMGILDPVLSPTFALICEYPGPLPLLHADVYRLSEAELPGVGLEEALEGWPGLALVEWADRFPVLLPPDHLEISLGHAADGRSAQVVATGPRHAALLIRWQEEIRVL